MKTIFSTLFALSLIVTSGAFAATAPSDCSKEDHYPIIERAKLAEMAQAKSAFIVDVNSAESFKEVHVPGAIHYAAHKKDFAAQLPKDKNAPLVAYCGGVKCGAWKTAAERACKMGYTNIYHYKEGIAGWKKGT